MSNDIGFKGSLFVDGDIKLTSSSSTYNINGIPVLSSYQLGSNIVSSSLTTLGILSSVQISGLMTVTSIEVSNLNITNNLMIGNNILQGQYNQSNIIQDNNTLYSNLTTGIYLLYLNYNRNVSGVFLVDLITNNINTIYNSSNILPIQISSYNISFINNLNPSSFTSNLIRYI